MASQGEPRRTKHRIPYKAASIADRVLGMQNVQVEAPALLAKCSWVEGGVKEPEGESGELLSSRRSQTNGAEFPVRHL